MDILAHVTRTSLLEAYPWLEDLFNWGLLTISGCQRRYEIVRKGRRNFVIFRRWWVTKSAAALLKKSVHDLLLLVSAPMIK
jgi:hypothetical protein